MRRFLLSLTGLYVSLLLSTRVPAQDDAKKERLRFLDGRVELCEILNRDDGGVTLRLEGVPRPVKFPWWQIDPADAARLRERPGTPALPGPSADLSVPGLRIRTSEGRVYEGVPVPGAPAGELWLRNAEGRFVVPLGSVASQEEARFELARVYGPDEVFQILVGRLRPSTAEHYDRLGAELLRAKLKDRAMAAFRTAELLRHPDWPESRIHADLVRLRDRLEGLAVRRAVFEAEEGCLAGDYDRALAHLDEVEKGLGGSPGAEGVLDELRRLRVQLHSLRGVARDERIVHEGYRTIEAFVKVRAMDRALPWAEARAYAEERMAGEVMERLRWRFNFTPGDATVRQAWERRPEDAMRKHSWDEASWLALRPEARDPQAWWAAASDLARYNALKGIYVEKHLRVLAAESKSCGACGGSGQDASGAGCPSCAGVKSQRVVIYR